MSLRPPRYAEVLEVPPALELFEVISENILGLRWALTHPLGVARAAAGEGNRRLRLLGCAWLARPCPTSGIVQRGVTPERRNHTLAGPVR